MSNCFKFERCILYSNVKIPDSAALILLHFQGDIREQLNLYGICPR